jgi:hypothetical protein
MYKVIIKSREFNLKPWKHLVNLIVPENPVELEMLFYGLLFVLRLGRLILRSQTLQLEICIFHFPETYFSNLIHFLSEAIQMKSQFMKMIRNS